jgi:hypothetical protein
VTVDREEGEDEDPPIEVPIGIPLPTLLDYYSTPTAAARLDDPASHAISFRPSSGAGGAGDYADVPALSGPEVEAADLAVRLQKWVVRTSVPVINLV